MTDPSTELAAVEAELLRLTDRRAYLQALLHVPPPKAACLKRYESRANNGTTVSFWCLQPDRHSGEHRYGPLRGDHQAYRVVPASTLCCTCGYGWPCRDLMTQVDTYVSTGKQEADRG